MQYTGTGPVISEWVAGGGWEAGAASAVVEILTAAVTATGNEVVVVLALLSAPGSRTGDVVTGWGVEAGGGGGAKAGAGGGEVEGEADTSVAEITGETSVTVWFAAAAAATNLAL